jgi:uncharacterized membrane protein YhaH (DUF805 family)
MALVAALALAATAWARSAHDGYMASRCLALFAMCVVVFAFPQGFLDGLSAKGGRGLVFGAIGLLAAVGLFLAFVFLVVKPAQDAHATWLPKTLRNWCADAARGRPGADGPGCR